MARVEHSWFRRVIPADMELPRIFQDEDAGFDLVRECVDGRAGQ